MFIQIEALSFSPQNHHKRAGKEGGKLNNEAEMKGTSQSVGHLLEQAVDILVPEDLILTWSGGRASQVVGQHCRCLFP